MKPGSIKPLIACATNEDRFCEHVEAAAFEIGTDFWASKDLKLSFNPSQPRRLSCLVVDDENAVGWERQLSTRPVREAWPLLVVVPAGDCQAAFRAASMGAVNIIEKPNLENELLVNLRTALDSETRMDEIRNSEKRFADPVFDCLSAREKAILRLLMDGEPNKRVAAVLDVGLRTVEAERAQVIKKLPVSSFVELIRFVAQFEHDFLSTRKKIFGNMLRS